MFHHLLSRRALGASLVLVLAVWPSPADAGATVRIDNMSYEADRHSVVLAISGPVTISTRSLKAPNRLVVDLPAATLVSKNRELVIEDALVKRVRMSQFKIIPPTVRVVIETAGDDEPVIAVQQTAKNLYITVARPGDLKQGDSHEHDHDHDADEHEDEDHAHDHDHDADEHEHEDADHEHDHDHEHEHSHELDEHVWTDPENAIKIVKRLTQALVELDPANAEFYQANADKYVSELEKLDQDFEEMVESAKRKTIVVGDRFPFRYLVEAYDLDYYAAFPGCSTEGDASPQTLVFLIDKVKSEQIPVVFHIELSNMKMAESIADATGAEVMLLHGAHNISKEDFEQGLTYLEIMRQNLENLRHALND